MPADAVTLVMRDHRMLEQLFTRLRETEDQGDREELREQMAAMFVAHSRAEEEHIYPAVVEHVPAEDDEVHHGREEHAEAEGLLQELLALDVTGEAFEVKLVEFVEAVQHHVEEEESEILPALEEAADRDVLEELGEAFLERREDELTARGVVVPEEELAAAAGL